MTLYERFLVIEYCKEQIQNLLHLSYYASLAPTEVLKPPRQFLGTHKVFDLGRMKEN